MAMLLKNLTVVITLVNDLAIYNPKLTNIFINNFVLKKIISYKFTME